MFRKIGATAGLATILMAASPEETRAQELEYTVTSPATIVIGNTVLHTLAGGVGAAINGKPIFNAAKTGFLSGLLVGGAKYCAGQTTNCAWPAKIATALGTSATINTALGRPALETVGTDLGPLYLELNFGNGKPLLRPYLLPETTFDLIRALSRGELDLTESLELGTPVTYTEQENIGDVPGQVYTNVITLSNDLRDGDAVKTECRDVGTYGMDCTTSRTSKDLTRRHENIHVNQYEQRRIFSALIPKWQRVKETMNNYFLSLDNTISELTIHPALYLPPKKYRLTETEAYSLTLLPRRK